MAARRRTKDEIAALITRLKMGIVGGLRQEIPEGMTVNDFDHAFETVDAALLSHGTIANTSSSSLRQFRNAQRSPIYQLPLEVLTTVLIFASGILDDSRELFDRSSLAKPLIKIVLALAHVSSGWYKVVESLPILWTHILADLPPYLVRMAIVRSRKLPLTVTCWSRPNEKRKEFLEELSPHSHRWEAASLALTMKDLKRITQSCAPLLKAFSLMPLAENERESYVGLAEEKPMAKELFQGQMPKLEVLKIPYWLKWDEIAYPKLKNLDIKYYVGDLPSVEELIRMISGCPMLESLSISAPIYDPGPGFPGGPSINLAHLQIIRVEKLEYLALANLLLRLNLPAVKTVSIALDEMLEDDATMDAISFIVITAIKPVIQRMSDWAGTIFVELDQDDGVQLAFHTSETHTSIELSNFRWTGVMKTAINGSKAFVERTKYLNVTGGGGVRLSSTGAELVELVTSLRFLNEVTLDENPNSAEILSMLLNAGNRDAQPLEGAALWQDLTAIELEGCLCDQMDDLLLVLEKWKDRRKKKLQKYLPHISIRPRGFMVCGSLSGALQRLVEEGEQYWSEAESDDETEG